MHSRFRPIIAENVQKSISLKSEPTETVSTTVIRPVAISPKAKRENAELPSALHDFGKQSVALFKPFTALDASKISSREHYSDSSFNQRDGSFRSQKSAPEDVSHLADVSSSIFRRGTSLDCPSSDDLKLSPCPREDMDPTSSVHGYTLRFREKRSESGKSQEQVSIPSVGGRNTLETISTSAFDSGDEALKNHSGDLDIKVKRKGGETTMTNSNDFPAIATAAEMKKSPSESLVPIEEEADSTQSLPPLLSPKFSNGESDKYKELQSHKKMQRNSSGNRISLKRSKDKLEEKLDSDDEENPWFRRKSSSKGDEEEENLLSSESEERKSVKVNKKKVGMFRRIFRSSKRNETGSQDDSLDSSSGELSLKESISDDSSDPADATPAGLDASERHLEQTLSSAIAGKQSIDEVVDAMLGVAARPCDRVMKLLTKYMSSNVVIDAAFKVILEHEHTKKAGIPMKNMAPSHARYSPPREALVNLFSSGPERVRKALLNHNKAKSEIFRFFTDEKPTREVEIPHWTSTATNLARILNGLLEHFPSEISEYIGGKKGLLHLMIKNHVHVPEVIEFIIQLSAANALSKSTGEELRYGASNATGLVTLAKENICDLLVEIFKKSCVATAQGKPHLLEWQTQVMSTRCLLELSKRAISIPRFTKDNCSYSGRHIRTLNSSLDELSLYNHDTRILALLNAGFDAVLDGPEIENVRERSERNNPLVCALGLIIELLETVQIAAGSKLVVTRKTVGNTNTAKIEKHLVSKMVRLCKLLHHRSASDVSYQAKMAIVNVFRCLSSSTIESTRAAMVKSQIPDRLMVLVREHQEYSVLHSCVLKCLSASLNSPQSTELHKEWLRALARSDGWLQIMYEYFHQVKGWETHRRLPCFSTYIEIGFHLVDFSQDEKEERLEPMLTTKKELQTYVDGIEAGLMRMRREYKTPCGGPKPSERFVSVLANAETLAAKLHDYDAV